MRRLAALVVFAVLASSCGDDGAPTASSASTTSSTSTPSSMSTTLTEPPGEPAAYVPGDDWETVDPATAGFDPAGLAAATALAAERQSHCLLVLRRGRIVHEWYADGVDADDDFEVFSVTKSVAAAIVGAAVTAGYLDVDDAASEFITEWQGTDSADVTIEQMLQNISGRFYDPVPDLVELGTKPDMTAHAIGLHQADEPGTVWHYNQSAIQTLEVVLERATGHDPGDFATENLFEPIGMDATFRRDEAGNIPMFAGLQAGCRDLGRFALLTARRGRWGDRQVIDRDYMVAATTGSEVNAAYGYLYWHNAEPGTWDHTNPARDRTRRFWPDVPIDAFSANGLGEQFAMVFPTDDVVVVRLGAPAGVQGYPGVLANDLAGAVYEAIVE